MGAMALVVPKIESLSVSDKVYRWLRENIINLSLPPGHKLNVRELGVALGVSSSPITHALYRLAGEDLVEISPHKETRVKSISKQDIKEIWDARLSLELGTLDMLKVPLKQKDIDEIQSRYQEAIRQDGGDETSYKRYVENDYQFHLSLIKLAGNNRISRMYEQLSAHMQLIRFGLMHKVRRISSRLNDEHLSIVQSLEKGDIQKAKDEIRNHVTRMKALDFNLEIALS